MEVAPLFIRLLVTVLTLRCSYAQKHDAALSIKPNRLQFFEYEPVTFHCEVFDGSTGWTFVNNLKGEKRNCTFNRSKAARLSCSISSVYQDDSGEYWCEAAGGRRSNSINITVTAGSVILESPALPVEGNNVTLRCRSKTTSTNLPADFYKDGLFIRSSSTGEMIINNVSKSDEGLYKCNISGAGGSAESWLRLAVRVENSITESNAATSPSAVPWIIVTLLLAVLLVVIGILRFGKALLLRVGSLAFWHQREPRAADDQQPANTSTIQTREREDRHEVTSGATYYILGGDETEQPDQQEVSPESAAVYYTLDLDETQQLDSTAANKDRLAYASVATTGKKKKGERVSSITTSAVPSADTNPHLTENAFYSVIQEVTR